MSVRRDVCGWLSLIVVMIDGTAASTEMECRKARLFTVSDWLRRWPSEVGRSARGFVVGMRSGTCARDVDFDTLSAKKNRNNISL